MFRLFFFLIAFIFFLPSFAGVKLYKKVFNSSVVYYFKTYNSEYKIFYVPTDEDSFKIYKVLEKNIFSDDPLSYKITYYGDRYQVFINKDLLFSFDKRTAYKLGFSNIEQLITSYRYSLNNLSYLPLVFFEKDYIKLFTNESLELRVFNKTGQNFSIILPEYCYYKDGKVFINPKEPVSNQSLVINYPDGQDISYLTIVIPSFEVSKSNYIVYLSSFSMKDSIDWIKNWIFPNINYNSQLNYKLLSDSRNVKKYSFYSENSNFPFGDVQKNVNIIFKENEKLQKISFDKLIISNNPERIDRKGIIYLSKIEGRKGYFIWFHHTFASTLNYCIEVVNNSELNCSIKFFGSFYKDGSEVKTGISASTAFYKFLINRDIFKISLSKGEKFRFISQKVYPNENISGFFYVESDQDLELKIYAFDTIFPDNKLPREEVRTTGVFSNPFIEKEVVFNTENKFLSFRFPQENEILNNFSQYNYSNYGVLYKVNFKFINPSSEKKKVILYYSSVSGYSPFVFLMNNSIFRLDSGIHKRIMSFSLDPDSQYVLPISFVITPGLNYPIEFEISIYDL
jgi:hypothetical protein